MMTENTVHLLNPCLTIVGWSKGKLICYQKLYSEHHNLDFNVQKSKSNPFKIKNDS